ncbi:hypothetical protein [Oceanobacillus saliphilus]|uniref:hypothetical protein n=1 Tax=Oceanobacillus saliphilus TaxID=2925834 RepID=UPI00201E1DDC|nr:hypothetical protein [Oceanobacillus saliphilus]
MHLTQKQLQDILMTVYEKGNQSKDVNVMEIVNDMKQSLLFTTNQAPVHKQDIKK